LPSTLTSTERRDLERAERKIAAGLKAFLEVGLALKEIRDKRLYRQEYANFEQYCTIGGISAAGEDTNSLVHRRLWRICAQLRTFEFYP
jgi:hypothetical protein